MVRENTFSKNEKLCSTKSIEKLFSSGSSFIAYPIRVVFSTENEPDRDKQIPAVLISVSKKKFKRAVKRNRVKRLIREAYRLKKSLFHDLLQQKGRSINIAFLYLKDELPEYAEIEKAIQKAGAILTEKLQEKE